MSEREMTERRERVVGWLDKNKPEWLPACGHATAAW